MSSNPFKFGKVVRDDSFCNRIAEMKDLHNYINDGISVWLYSPRRFGKTSLVKKVFNDLEEVKTIYIDLYNITSMDDFAKRYARLLALELFDWKENIKELSKKLAANFKGLQPSVTFDEKGTPSFSIQANKVESQVDIETILNIPNEIGKRTGQKICVAFDEFQEINRIEPFLVNWMRSSFQMHEYVSYVFLGSKQSLMQSIFSSYSSPFYEFGVKMNITPIGRKDWKKFVREKFKSVGITINTNVLNELLDISECHPHFTQYFASEVFYLIKFGGNQYSPDFTNVWLSKVIESQSHIFQNIFDQLSNIQRTVVIALVRLEEGEGLFSATVRDKYGLPVSSSLNTTLQGLIKKDLVNQDENAYRIINPVFKQWLKTLIQKS
ncbi:MAG: ATP-binding protein [Prolixibacteraceae bacterium]|jgi:AAA+ ATPase superfamily predicted ATPase|nr:ATP-binding protein [Prolixibacteraceae bacterium]